MKKLFLLIALFLSFRAFGQTTTPPINPQQVLQNTLYNEPSTHKMYGYRGPVFGWWNMVDSIQLERRLTLQAIYFDRHAFKGTGTSTSPIALGTDTAGKGPFVVIRSNGYIGNDTTIYVPATYRSGSNVTAIMPGHVNINSATRYLGINSAKFRFTTNDTTNILYQITPNIDSTRIVANVPIVFYPELQSVHTPIVFNDVANKGYVDAQQLLKANLLSPVFTGIPRGPTATGGTNTTQLATTAFVFNAISGFGHGTVTSVGATGSNGVIVGGSSPITGSGIFTFQIDSLLYQTVTGVLPLTDTRYEQFSNKVTDFSTINNALYPTTQAVADYVSTILPTGVNGLNGTGNIGLGGTLSGVTSIDVAGYDLTFQDNSGGVDYAALSFSPALQKEFDVSIHDGTNNQTSQLDLTKDAWFLYTFDATGTKKSGITYDNTFQQLFLLDGINGIGLTYGRKNYNPTDSTLIDKYYADTHYASSSGGTPTLQAVATSGNTFTGQIVVQSLNINGPSGAGYINLATQGADPAFPGTGTANIYIDPSGWLTLRGGGAGWGYSFSDALLTGYHTYVLPNADGTLALTSNLAAYVPYTGATTTVNLNTQILEAGQIGAGTTSPTGILNTISTSISTIRGAIFDQYSTDANGSKIFGRKSRGTLGSPTSIVSGDNLFGLNGSGYDPAGNFIDATRILSGAAGTISAGVIPGTLTFMTANPSGVLTTGIFLDQNQNLTFGHYGVGLAHLSSVGLLTSSLVVVGDISATGTPGSTTYLNGAGAWATPPGTGITALTGDVTASGTGSVAATLKNTGTPSTYGQVTTDAQGRVTAGTVITPYANGGTNASTSWTSGSLLGAGASGFVQDNANLFYDFTNHWLGLGTAVPTNSLTFSSTSTGWKHFATTDQVTNTQSVSGTFSGSTYTLLATNTGSAATPTFNITNTNGTLNLNGGGTTLALGATTSTTAGFGNLTRSSSAAVPLFSLTGTTTASSSIADGFVINRTYNQTSTAGGTDIKVLRTETAVGSGAQNFLDFQVGGSSKFRIDHNNLFYFATVAGTANQVPIVNTGGTAMTWGNLLSKPHTIFTPTTGGTVALVNNQYNIINPSGALLALTVTLPSSPANNDCVFIKFTQNVTTVTYSGGTVVDGITAPTAGGLTVLTYDSGTTSWY